MNLWLLRPSNVLPGGGGKMKKQVTMSKHGPSLILWLRMSHLGLGTLDLMRLVMIMMDEPRPIRGDGFSVRS